jgi:hypothetical protein
MLDPDPEDIILAIIAVYGTAASPEDACQSNFICSQNLSHRHFYRFALSTV